jgi:hypothetical protein
VRERSIGASLGIALIASLLVAFAAPTVAAPRFVGVDVEVLGDVRRVVFHFSQPVGQVTYFRLAGPSRLVIDVSGATAARGGLEEFPVEDPVIARVRIGRHDGWLRLVIDLEDGAPERFSVRGEGTSLVTYLGEPAPGGAGGGSEAGARPGEGGSTEGPAPAPAAGDR